MSSGYDNTGGNATLTLARDTLFALDAVFDVAQTGATVVAGIYTPGPSPTSVQTFTTGIGGTGDKTISMTLTKALVAALSEDGYRWALIVNDVQIAGGDVEVRDIGDPTGIPSSTITITTASFNVNLQAIGAGGTITTSQVVGLSTEYAALAGGNTFTGAQVVPDATADTHALNRQTGDGRYQPLMYGTGAPNGVRIGSVGDRYIDRAATLGARVWYKATGAATNTGWLIAEGDTGWRTVASWTAGVQDVSNQIGTIAAGYTKNGTGKIEMRRIDGRTLVRMPNSGANALASTGAAATSLFTAAASWAQFAPEFNSSHPLASTTATNYQVDLAATSTNPRIWTPSGAALLTNAYCEWQSVPAWFTAALPGV